MSNHTDDIEYMLCDNWGPKVTRDTSKKYFQKFKGLWAEYHQPTHHDGQKFHLCGCVTRLLRIDHMENEEYKILLETPCKELKIKFLKVELVAIEEQLKEVKDELFRLEHGPTPSDLEKKIADADAELQKSLQSIKNLTEERNKAQQQLEVLKSGAYLLKK